MTREQHIEIEMIVQHECDFFTMDFAAYMNHLWSCHKKMEGKFITKKNMLRDLFKFSFYPFSQLIFS